MASEHSESLDTNSTSLVEDSLNISFENINYTVRNILVSCERKTILNNVNGTFNAGELTVIMGPSGSGKSTLMDILSGYTKPTSGNLLVNGRVRNEMMFRRRSCYILQDDIVQDKLTIQESLNIAADLKLGDHISKEQKRLRIEEVIISLRLSEARNIRAEQLSGGQRKRLSIGLELITDPLVMFLDEPTSGLDSSITKDLVYLLHLLARQGRTIVATVHQPSALVLHMVDKLYAIVEGRCAYIGSVPQLLPYLEEIELKCPPYNNPVDFLIEKCDENQNALVEHAENGKSRRWTANISHENDRKLKEKCNIREEVCLTLLPPSHDDPNNKILLALKSTYPTSIWRQFITLTRRSLLTVWRSPLTVLRLTGSHFALALLIGTLLYQIGEDGDNGRMIYNFLFFSLMFVMFTAFSWVSIRFPGEIPVIRREHFNRWYTAEAYCMSTLVCTLPIQTVCTLTYTITAYLLTGQPLEAIRFFRFCFMMLMVSYVALFQGLLIGSACSVKYAVIIGPFCIMPFTIFAGFFLRYVDAPFFLQWLFYLSFLKYGFDGLLLSIFDMKRTNLKCTDIFCYYGHPNQFLHDHGIRNVKYTELVGALFAIAAIIILSAFIMLKIRIKCKW